MTELMRPDDLKKISNDADMAKAQDYLRLAKKQEEEQRGLRWHSWKGKSVRKRRTPSMLPSVRLPRRATTSSSVHLSRQLLQ
jgi:hypothetical protein